MPKVVSAAGRAWNMAGRGRSGRFASIGRGRVSACPDVGGGGGGNGARGGRDVCACEANAPLLGELRKLDGECLRQGKQNLRHGVLRAIKSVKLYPLPITTEAEACNLEGVGSFTARRMLKGLPPAATLTTASAASRAPAKPARCRAPPTTAGAAASRTNDEENIEPRHVSSGSNERTYAQPPGRRQAPTDRSAGATCSAPATPHDGISLLRPVGASARYSTQRALSLTANISALRGEEETRALDVTPRRPTSRARREEGEGGSGVGKATSSEAPNSFSGHWEAWLIVDNREHECMSVQSALLQKGVRCETRQLPLGDMLWVARREDVPAPEVLLGYIVERKTAPDLASSIVDGRYDEQKRRLKLSGLRRRIYLVEGNLSHQNQMAPAALRAALATSQACSGLAVVRCASLRDTVDFLARTHRHVASLLRGACSASDKSWAENSGNWPGGTTTSNVSQTERHARGDRVRNPLRPAMTYDEYAVSCAKRAGGTTARKVLGAMVRQAPGCSAARAEAVVRAFESPLGLMLAFERAAGGGKEGEAVDDAERSRRVEELLGELRCRGGAGTNKLPQPLRRLLCRLFLRDSLNVGDRSGEGGAGQGGGDAEEEAFCCGWGVEPMSQDDGY